MTALPQYLGTRMVADCAPTGNPGQRFHLQVGAYPPPARR